MCWTGSFVVFILNQCHLLFSLLRYYLYNLIFQTWKAFVHQQQEMRDKYMRAEDYGEKRKCTCKEGTQIPFCKSSWVGRAVCLWERIALGLKGRFVWFPFIFSRMSDSLNRDFCMIRSLWFSLYGMVLALTAHSSTIYVSWLSMPRGCLVLGCFSHGTWCFCLSCCHLSGWTETHFWSALLMLLLSDPVAGLTQVSI